MHRGSGGKAESHISVWPPCAAAACDGAAEGITDLAREARRNPPLRPPPLARARFKPCKYE